MLRSKYIFDYTPVTGSKNSVMMVVTMSGIKYVQKTYIKDKIKGIFVCPYCSREFAPGYTAYFAYDYNAGKTQVCCGRCHGMITRMFDYIDGVSKLKLGKLEYIRMKTYRNAIAWLKKYICGQLYLCGCIFSRDIASVVKPFIAGAILIDNRCSWEDLLVADV